MAATLPWLAAAAAAAADAAAAVAASTVAATAVPIATAAASKAAASRAVRAEAAAEADARAFPTVAGLPATPAAAAAVAASPHLEGIIRSMVKLVEHHGKSGCDGNSNTPVLVITICPGRSDAAHSSSCTVCGLACAPPLS